MRKVLEKFYTGLELIAAKGRLFQLVTHNGSFGDHVCICREAADKVNTAGKYHIHGAAISINQERTTFALEERVWERVSFAA